MDDIKDYLYTVAELKEWWNRNAKEKFRVTLTQEEFALSVRKTYERVGYIVMPSWQNKREKEIQFFGKTYFWDKDYKEVSFCTE